MYLFAIGAVVTIVGVAIGVFIGGYLADREGRKGEVKPKEAPAPAPVKPAEPAQPTEKRRLWFVSSNQPDLAVQFQTWAGTNLQNADLRSWIAGLSKEQVRALTEQLSAFCGSLGFDLNWLTSQRLTGNPELEQTASEIVERYCTACLQATTVQSDLQQFKKALDLIDQPFSRDHKPITQKIYAELVRRNVAEPMSPELMVATEQERQEQIARVLKDVSAANWATFMEAFEAATRVEDANKEQKSKEGWGSGLRRAFRPREATAAATSDTTNLTPQPATENGV